MGLFIKDVWSKGGEVVWINVYFNEQGGGGVSDKHQASTFVGL